MTRVDRVHPPNEEPEMQWIVAAMLSIVAQFDVGPTS